MAWNTPKVDWETGELVTATNLDQIGENLNTLKSPPTVSHVTTTTYSVNSSTFVDVNATNLNLSLDTNGGDVLIHFEGVVSRLGNDNGDVFFDVEVDGNRLGGTNGITQRYYDSAGRPIGFTRLHSLSAGSHTFKLQWRETGPDSAQLAASAQFWVREVS